MNKPYNESALGTIADFSYGYTATAQDTGDTRFIRITDIDENGSLKQNDAKYIDYTDELERYQVKKGDLLVARTGGTFGKTLLYKDDSPAIYASFLIKITLNNGDLLPDFYFHFSQSSRYWFQANNLVTGGGQPQFNANVLKEIAVPLPPLPEQKAIADMLSTWDEAIEKTERLIQAKEMRFKWMLRELISEPRNTQKDAKWKKVKLGDLFGKDIKVEKGKALTKESNLTGDIPVVAGGQTYAYFTNHPTHEMSTVTVSASGAYAGFVWYHDYPIWASDCNVLFATNGVTKFLYFTLKAIQHRVYALQSGGAQPHVYSKDMKNLHIIWPSTEKQKQISETLSFAQHEIDLLKQLADKYKTQKRGLMQKMLTGEWRIKPEFVNQYMEA